MPTIHEPDVSQLDSERDDGPAPLNDESPVPAPKRTPLPKFQLLIVFLIQLAEPVTGTVIYPFVNQFVRDTGVINGDERKTGYYAGVIGSLFFFAEALTALQWGWASDRFGRRPILLLGPIGLSLAMLSFGLSSRYWMLVVSRCIQGVFNGNIGVSKSIIAEITDSTNMADAYAMMPLMWIFGSTIGPVIGGILSEPAKRWPTLFGKIEFFHHYPYFLPCAVAGLLAFVSGAVAFLGLKETSPVVLSRQKIEQRKDAAKVDPNSATRLLDIDDGPDYGSHQTVERLGTDSDESDETPPPVSALLIRQVLIPLVVYMFMTFTDMCSQVLLPLVYSSSISLGGLGFDPYHIGVILGIWGVINALFQFSFLGRLIRTFGPRKVQILAHTSYFVNIGLYPLLSYFAQRSGRVDGKVWAVIVIQLVFRLTNTMAYGSIQILIVDSAPRRSALGATNGLAQALGSVTRSIAPSVASSLVSISMERRLAGGNMVYIILSGVALIGIRLTLLLPKRLKL